MIEQRTALLVGATGLVSLSSRWPVVLLLIGAMSIGIAQGSNDSGVAPSRFSIGVHGSYHFNPWDDFNQSLETFNDRLRFVPYYGSPQGKFETIHGDATIEGVWLYHWLDYLDIFVASSYTRTGSRSNVAYTTTMFGQSEYNRFTEELQFSVWDWCAGARYTLRLSPAIKVMVRGMTGFAYGRMVFDHELDRDRHDSYHAELRQTVPEAKLGIDFGIEITPGASLVVSGEYRFLSFSNLHGPATYIYRGGYEEKKDYEARLLYTDGYFGITDQEGYPISYPWNDFRKWGDLQYAFLSLRSFGLRVGFEVEL